MRPDSHSSRRTAAPKPTADNLKPSNPPKHSEAMEDDNDGVDEEIVCDIQGVNSDFKDDMQS